MTKPDAANDPSSGLPPGYRVIVGGKDMSKYVLSLSNQFQLDETDAQSTVSLRADTAQENIQLLRDIIDACNNQIAAKIYVRGVYSNKEKLRMAGYSTQVSGANFFAGVTLIIKQLAANSEAPDVEDSDPYTDKSIRDIVLDIIDKYGMVAGKVDAFPQRMGAWYPGNRTFTEQLSVLADAAGAVINLHPPIAKIKDGKIKVDGIFEVPKPEADMDPLTEEERKKYEKALFRLRAAEEDPTRTVPGTDVESMTLDDRIQYDHLTPRPGDVGGEIIYGPGKKVREGSLEPTNGLYYAPDKGTKYSGQKSKEQQYFEKLQQDNIDPAIKDLIDRSKVQVYKDRQTGEIIQAVTMIDNSGKEIIVPVKTAAASLKGRMVVDFIDSDEKKGMLGDSGLIMTLKPVDFEFPYIKVKDIIGFEYAPPRTQDEAAGSSPSTDGINGAARKNFLTSKIQVKPTDTIDSIANQNPDVFRRFIYKDELTGQTSEYILAFDPENLRVDKRTGTLEPYDEAEDKPEYDPVTGQKLPAREYRAITEDEFKSLSPQVVHELYLKRRAALYAAGQDRFIETFYPELNYDKAETAEERQRIIDLQDAALAWELDNNLYVDSSEGKGTDKIIYTNGNQFFPPVFRATDTVGSFLGKPTTSTEKIDLYLGGQAEGKREDGVTQRLRANTIMFNAATGAKLSGAELNKKDGWPFSMTITIDNCVELIPGMTINCDETFGPFMGPYTLFTVSESISGSSMSMTLELRTQAYMDGYGRKLNSPTSSGTDGNGVSSNTIDAAPGAKSGEVIPTDSTRPLGNGAGGRIVQMAQQGLRANWNAKTPGFCSAWTRAVVEHAYNLPSSIDRGGALSSIFGGDAIETEKLMKKAGLASPYKKDTLQAGDLIIIGHGSGGFGHIGIYGGDGYVYENSWRHGGPSVVSDGRYRTPLDVFVAEKPTSVVRSDSIDQYIKKTR
jgi:hypothetical protein